MKVKVFHHDNDERESLFMIEIKVTVKSPPNPVSGRTRTRDICNSTTTTTTTTTSREEIPSFFNSRKEKKLLVKPRQ